MNLTKNEKRLTVKLVKALPDWNIMPSGVNCWEIENWSPAGEDVIITLRGTTMAELASDAEDAWENFNADEHAAEWYGANRGEPSSMRDLLDDAEAIEEMYKDVYEAINAAA